MHTHGNNPNKEERRKRIRVVPGGGTWTGLARLVHGTSVITLFTAFTGVTGGVKRTVLWATIILLMIAYLIYTHLKDLPWLAGTLDEVRALQKEAVRRSSSSALSRQECVRLLHTHRPLLCFCLSLRSLLVEAGAALL